VLSQLTLSLSLTCIQQDEAPLGVVQVEEAGVGEATESDRKNVFRVETKVPTCSIVAAMISISDS